MVNCQHCGSELPSNAAFCPKCGAPIVQQAATPSSGMDAPVREGLKIAFWGERFVAWIIDAIIIGVVTFLISFSVSLISFAAMGGWSWWSGWPSWVPFFNYGSVIYFLYWLLMDGAYGQSVGKMVMHLKVVRLDGSPMKFEQAAIESVGKAFLLPLDVLIGWILWPRRRQRLFNYLSGTVVIRQTADNPKV
jgi:uncharacterized RDD family membrane protein YckC